MESNQVHQWNFHQKNSKTSKINTFKLSRKKESLNFSILTIKSKTIRKMFHISMAMMITIA